jgi:glutamate--cysteine ligase catalytic subunit
LVIFNKKIDIDDPKDFSHFENLQSTNWNTVRFKPPKIEDNDSCFKVEIRPCELQITPYENAAIASFVLLLYKMSYRFNYNFIIPITKVDENIKRSYLNDAVTKQKFFFRTNFLLKDYKKKSNNVEKDLLGLDESYFDRDSDNQNIQEMTIDEILNGCEKFNFPGLLPVVYEFIDLYEDQDQAKYYKNHLEFLRLRSKGVLWTDAKYMRNFVLEHPRYKRDSVLNDVNSKT